MEVTVVIPSFNEEKNIENTLLSIKSQTKQVKEIIVVDSLSNDRTVEIAKKYAKVISVKSNVPEARNIGGKKAKSELLLFLDADTILSSNVIEELSKEFKKKNTVIASLQLFPSNMRLINYIIFKTAFYLFPILCTKMRIKDFVNFCGACIMVRKSAFDKIGGFREELKSGDDLDFVTRISRNGDIAFNKDTFALTDMRRFETNPIYWGIYWGINFFYYKLTKKTFKKYKKIR